MPDSDIPHPSGPPDLFGGQPPLEILAPIASVDHRDARTTLAARYARFWCLPLRLVHVRTPDEPPDDSTIESTIESTIARLRSADPEQVVTGEVLAAETVASGIGRAATDRSVVVLPSQRGSRWLDERSVAVTLVQSLGGLVMLHGPECHDPPIGTSVIVPLDGSRLAERALEPAMAVAAAAGATVWFVTVTPAATIDTAGELMLEGIVDAERRYLTRITSRFSEAPAEVRWDTAGTGDGDPVASIDAMAAEHGSSLIVAATHGDTEGERQQFGSVCMGLVERGRAPVLIVPPGGSG